MGKVNQEFEHLSDAQIENYGAPNHPAGGDQAVETHLAACAGCRTRLLTFHRTRLGLMIDLPAKAARRPDCPPEDSLRNLAAGIAPASDAPRLTAHAAQCDHCGPILRAYFEEFSDDLSADEQALLSRAALSPARRQKVADQLAAAVAPAQSLSPETAATGRAVERMPQTDRAGNTGVAQPGSSASPVLAGRGGQPPSAVQKNAGPSLKPSLFRLPWFRWALVPATAIACALFAFFIWNAQRETPEKVEKLLAQAYTEQRTMEMRIPGAQYAPIRPQERGEALNESPHLFEAKAAILRAIQTKREDPKWLHALGRERLIEGRFEEAIATLRQGLQSEPSSTDLMIDLASAHYERGRRMNNSEDYRSAIELLSDALSRQPDNATAIFNRATLYGTMSPPLYESALQDWDRYLRIDPNSSWSEEAQRTKNQIEQLKKNSHSINP